METTDRLETRRQPWILALGALGVVFGDIGTSPLYAVQECVSPLHGVSANNAENLWGITSLIFWLLTMVVTFKYILFIMKADNRGEGGIMALLALLPEKMKVLSPGKLGAASLLVISGAALLFGDGIITPAISVLSAVEGLKVAAPALDHFVVPITVAILIGLFLIQKKGTQRIGNYFGPIMLVWFICLGGLGLYQVVQAPEVLKALSPLYAFRLFENQGWHAFRLLGSVVLAITGAEALYADMGHFGKHPIQLAWFSVVFPCLILNYLGQAALLSLHPNFASNPFYGLVPARYLIPMIVLSTAATVIASQALISGAFSLTSQAIRLGYFPRLSVKHTSAVGEGQIYVPAMNLLLAVFCILLVFIFQSSAGLAAAYGLAVTGTMAITSIVFMMVCTQHWRWNPLYSYGLMGLFLLFDIPLFCANLLKFFDGGWIPILAGMGFFTVMALWKKGRTLLVDQFEKHSTRQADFLTQSKELLQYRIPGVAVFLSSSPVGISPVLVQMAIRFHALHEEVILLKISSEDIPFFSTAPHSPDRVEVAAIGNGFFRVTVRYGFMEIPDIPSMLLVAFEKLKLARKAEEIVYIVGNVKFVETHHGKMPGYQQMIYAFLSRNSKNATDFFSLPYDQVIELGTPVDL